MNAPRFSGVAGSAIAMTIRARQGLSNSRRFALRRTANTSTLVYFETHSPCDDQLDN